MIALKFKMKCSLKSLSGWPERNLMLINQNKSNFIMYTRSKENFTTRISIDDSPIDRVTVTKLLEVWLQEDMGWDKNTK